jgi:hypothetical protein
VRNFYLEGGGATNPAFLLEPLYCLSSYRMIVDKKFTTLKKILKDLINKNIFQNKSKIFGLSEHLFGMLFL